MSNPELVFDITKQPNEQTSQQLIIGRVGDGGLKAVTVRLMSNGKPYSLDKLNVVFEGKKPDGHVIIDQQGGAVVDPVGGVFRYIFPSEAFQASGRYEQAFFKVMRGDQVDTTLDFQLNVLENQVEFFIHSTDYITAYRELVDQLQKSFREAIQKLQETEKATKDEIDAQKAIADAIDERLKLLLDKINQLDLVKKADFDTTKTELEQNITELKTLIANIEARILHEVSEMKQTITDAKKQIDQKLKDTGWKKATMKAGFKGDKDAPPQYRVKMGTVMLRGLVFPDKGKESGVMFTLPQEAHSSTPYRQGFACGQISGIANQITLVYVQKNGDVELVVRGVDTGFWLDEIRYEVD